MVNLDTCAILVGNGPPIQNNIKSNFILGIKGNIYFGIGPPQKIFLDYNKEISIKSTHQDSEPISKKNYKAKLASKARLLGKLVTAVRPNEDQYKQIFENVCVFSDNESEASAKLYSKSISENFNSPIDPGIRLFLTKNRKYNEIVTSHARIAQALDTIDREMDEYVKNRDYKFDSINDDIEGLKSPFINHFQGSFMNDHKARVPSSLWVVG